MAVERIGITAGRALAERRAWSNRRRVSSQILPRSVSKRPSRAWRGKFRWRVGRSGSSSDVASCRRRNRRSAPEVAPFHRNVGQVDAVAGLTRRPLSIAPAAGCYRSSGFGKPWQAQVHRTTNRHAAIRRAVPPVAGGGFRGLSCQITQAAPGWPAEPPGEASGAARRYQIRRINWVAKRISSAPIGIKSPLFEARGHPSALPWHRQAVQTRLRGGGAAVCQGPKGGMRVSYRVKHCPSPCRHS